MISTGLIPLSPGVSGVHPFSVALFELVGCPSMACGKPISPFCKDKINPSNVFILCPVSSGYWAPLSTTEENLITLVDSRGFDGSKHSNSNFGHRRGGVRSN
jgi:hypothetical protein